MASSGKKTRGKQKIKMKIIEKEDEKLVTFSKRRSGIYKKISEITILCGTKILFICFPPEGKSFSFGHSSIDSLRNYLRLVRRTGGLRILVLHQWGIIVRDAREMGGVFVQGMYALENGHDDMPLYFDNMSFEGLLDVGELIGRSGTSLRVATIRANLRRRRFLLITGQPTAEAEKWTSVTGLRVATIRGRKVEEKLIFGGKLPSIGGKQKIEMKIIEKEDENKIGKQNKVVRI
ncbi:hypothetical protein GQ457_02G038870 [Hibiscus cannabinus]